MDGGMTDYPFEICTCMSANCYHKAFRRNLSDNNLHWERSRNAPAKQARWDEIVNKQPFALKGDLIELGLLDWDLGLEIEKRAVR